MIHLRSAMDSLRVRIALLFAGGLILAALTFGLLLGAAVRARMQEDLEFRGRSLAQHLAEDAAVPILVGDSSRLEDEAKRVTRQADVIGVEVFDERGERVSEHVVDKLRWVSLPGLDFARHPVTAGTGRPLRRAGTAAREWVVPVFRSTHRLEDPLLGAAASPSGPARSTLPIGFVRVVVSGERMEIGAADTARLGLFILLGTCVFGILVSALLSRVIVNPLDEASRLATQIAAGRFESRLPVRGGGEIGLLARSLNWMAASLELARQHEQEEAESLRLLATSVGAIARETQTLDDADEAFQVVALQLRAATGCSTVALAEPAEAAGSFVVRHCDGGEALESLRAGCTVELGDPLPANRDAPLLMQGGKLANPASGSLKHQDRSLYWAHLLRHPAEGELAWVLILAVRADRHLEASGVRIADEVKNHLAATMRAAQLRGQLTEAFENLRRTQEQLLQSERIRVTGEMASGIAHDFNNVLGAILARAQLLRQHAIQGEMPIHELVSSLSVIELATRDGKETVRRLRQFGTGEDRDRMEVVDLSVLLHDAWELSHLRFVAGADDERREVSGHLDLAPGVWTKAAPAQLREAFTNLILNAADALPDGGNIWLRTYVNDGRAVACVRDDGVGIPREVQSRIFDPFFTTKGPGGTGLGLPMVDRIVRNHGGTLKLRSALGEGAEFTLSFDRAEPVRPSAEGDGGGTCPAATAMRVLIVDDEPAIRELLADVLKELGHSAELCADAESAIRGFEPGRFDLVITDLCMPEVSGWELAHVLREHDRQVALAFITGWAEELDAARVAEAGVDAVVAKPFGIEDIARLAEVVARRKLGPAAAA